MKNYSLMVDNEMCIGCQACEIACKQENNLPVGPRWIRALAVGPKEIGGELKMSFAVVRCHHCANPPCMEVCPTDAIEQRADGIVLIKPELCIGCEACRDICPVDAVDMVNGKAEVDLDWCIGCGVCAVSCPTGSISIKRRSEAGSPESFTDLHEKIRSERGLN